MKLRPRTKAAAPPRASVNASDIAALAPFVDLPTGMLETIAGSTRRIVVDNRDWAYGKSSETSFFLVGGALRFSGDGRQPRQLKAGAPGSGFPLPCDDSWQIRGDPGASVLAVPDRYLEMAANLHRASTTDFDFHEDDVGGQIYLQFYEQLQQGGYELPSMPDLAIRIGKTIDDANTVNEDIARLIQLDPSLSARVISVVNSAAFAGIAQVKNMQDAVARLGRDQVRSLVFSIIIGSLFRTKSPELKKRMRALWQHSSRVAAISFVLARLTPGLDPNRALLAGLIHRIGGIPILEAARASNIELEDTSVLDQVLADLSGDIGALTLRQWKFDDELIDVARHASDWYRPGTALAGYLDVIQVAQLHARIGQQADPTLPIIDQIPAFQKLALGKLTPRHSIGILEEASKDIDEVERLLRGD